MNNYVLLQAVDAVVESGNGFYQFSIHGSLSAIHYPLFIIHYSLLTIRYSFTIRLPLPL
jgi:hypothetical protein